ncbi:MAG TPA: RNA helicase, partial [Bacillota bacterium]|nr:RNA helicase [Bacillota bacterium]
MARPFSSTDAKRLITEHQMLKKQLEDTQQFAQQNISEIKKAADTFVAEEVLKVLRNVPVDELNRDKRGIRIKPLLDSGFYTIADIATASIYQIASVRGISEDTAYTIRRIVNDFVN